MKEITRDKAILRGADDVEFFCRQFFPRTCPAPFPEFHKDLWKHLEGPNRFIAFKVFRGGGKTTALRLLVARRIAYGISKTILFVGKGQGHAITSVAWLREQIEHNTAFTGVFGLQKGSKWTDEHCSVKSALHKDKYGQPQEAHVIAYGISGQIRGVNIQDNRPDLIVIDDPCDEENTATQDQREKLEQYLFGALCPGLVPLDENKTAKIVLLQTKLHEQDLLGICEKDSNWNNVAYNIVDDKGESLWPMKWSTPTIQKMRKGYADRNQLSIWLREYEGKIVSPETSQFKMEWLKYYASPPEGNMLTVLAIDPVPPPTEQQLARRLRGKDYEVLCVVGLYEGRFYLLDYRRYNTHDAGWTLSNFFALAQQWRPMAAVVETTGYQTTLKTMIEEEMKKRKFFVSIYGVDSKERKFHRISGAFSKFATDRNFYVKESQREFLNEYMAYPKSEHDDVLDATALGLQRLRMMDFADENLGIPGIENTGFMNVEWRGCPTLRVN